MIVKYDDKTAYDALFKLINEACGSNVKDLPSYYKQLAAIRANKETVTQNKYYKFFRIPLEEEPFHINANTRVITVPTQFKTNGLGVKGDQLAEVIFFDIDRYFDTMDFSACDCFIQWINATGKESGITASYLLDFDEDKVIFGWPISEDITKEVGDVRFSVRFIQKKSKEEALNENNIIYSWSTLTATCPIKSALAFDVDNYEPDDLTDLMNSRIIYSGIVNSSDGAKPYIITDLPDTIDLSGLDGTAELTVTAESPDNGTLSYIWYKDSVVIPDEEANTYSANSIGTYRVKIGNTNSEFETTRYQDSQSCVIPGAVQPELEPDMNGLYAYSSNLSLKVKLTELAENNVVTYQWYKKTNLNSEGSVLVGNGANTATLTVENANRGIYYCTVTNTRNKDSKSVTSGMTDVRALPVNPDSVTISAEKLEDGNLKLSAIIDKGTGVPLYKWVCSQGNMAFSESESKDLVLTPDHFKDHTIDSFTCLVRMVEFNEKGPDGKYNNPLLKYSVEDPILGVRSSNEIKIIYKDGDFTIS